MTNQRATVREVDWQLVLDDPDGLAVLTAVNKHNCKNTFREQAERVVYFATRASARSPSDTPCVMVILNADEELGGNMAEILMPGNGAQWQAMRDADQVPFARGLAGREGMQRVLDEFDAVAAEKLRLMTDVLPVVVMDYDVIEVFRADGEDL